jgi:hypothetical protein
MEERNRRYYQAQDHDMGEDTSTMTPEKGVFLPGVTEADASWLVTVLAVLTMQGDLWISPTILAAKNGGYLAPEDTERARRLLDALKPHAKTNAELQGEGG